MSYHKISRRGQQNKVAFAQLWTDEYTQSIAKQVHNLSQHHGSRSVSKQLQTMSKEHFVEYCRVAPEEMIKRLAEAIPDEKTLYQVLRKLQNPQQEAAFKYLVMATQNPSEAGHNLQQVCLPGGPIRCPT
ncbi:hypothetical protein [Parendozoicomonas sp. Alg238-R29]|uniref:hypothetical protein n=1 Tax=Parendozoicomonas sp. Alg238-R29 TaxID=2993446 RepID=UPI00248D6D51|nr:hypothetical protein [Parendozoicomonas sp. Alg238-R29]